MFELLRSIFQIDWDIFMAGAQSWLQGQSPYARLASPTFGNFGPGAFAYPPTALPWLALFVPLGGLGYYVWTLLELALWWWIIRKDRPSQLLLICWSPLILHMVEGQSTLMAILVAWAAARAAVGGVIGRDAALAGLRLRDADPRGLGEGAERLGGFAVEHAAAGDDQRLLAFADGCRGRLQRSHVGTVARDGPHAPLEQFHRVVERLGLHVLRQRERHGAGVGGRGQRAHGLHQRRHELLRTIDAIPVARDGTEAVVDRHVA